MVRGGGGRLCGRCCRGFGSGKGACCGGRGRLGRSFGHFDTGTAEEGSADNTQHHHEGRRDGENENFPDDSKHRVGGIVVFVAHSRVEKSSIFEEVN